MPFSGTRKLCKRLSLRMAVAHVLNTAWNDKTRWRAALVLQRPKRQTPPCLRSCWARQALALRHPLCTLARAARVPRRHFTSWPSRKPKWTRNGRNMTGCWGAWCSAPPLPALSTLLVRCSANCCCLTWSVTGCRREAHPVCAQRRREGEAHQQAPRAAQQDARSRRRAPGSP